MKIKEKERMASMFYGLNIGDVFRDEYGTICMRIDDYDAKLHGDTGKLYKLNAVSLKMPSFVFLTILVLFTL